MRIQNNITAVNTHRQYTSAVNSLGKSAEKLSSGYRINRAGDDAAGLAISEKMRAQIRGLGMASKNSQDAVSLVQTAEGALQETHNILQRMRELAVQSSSDTNETKIDRSALQQEFSQLRDEINDIASKTRFNDQNLIDGTFQKYTRSLNSDATKTSSDFLNNIETISVGRAKAGDYVMSVQLTAAAAASSTAGTAVNASIYSPGTQAADIINNAATASTSAGRLSNMAISGLQTEAHNGNIYQLKIEGSDLSSMSFSLIDTHGATVARTNNVDASSWAQTKGYSVNFEGVGEFNFDITAGSSNLTVADLTSASGAMFKMDGGKDQVIDPAVQASLKLTINGESITVSKGDTTANFRQSGIAFNFKALSDLQFKAASSAFGADSISISVNEIKGADMIVQTGANQGDQLGINIDAMNSELLGIQYSSISTQKDSSKAITEVNDAINKVSTQRAALGALQNRLEYKINNLDTSAENLQAAESRIRDTDMAKEMTSFTKKNILIQASTAMLAQANSAPQNVLSLLG